jgi:hypothetical protein
MVWRQHHPRSLAPVGPLRGQVIKSTLVTLLRQPQSCHPSSCVGVTARIIKLRQCHSRDHQVASNKCDCVWFLINLHASTRNNVHTGQIRNFWSVALRSQTSYIHVHAYMYVILTTMAMQIVWKSAHTFAAGQSRIHTHVFAYMHISTL